METAVEGGVAKETVRLHRPCLQQCGRPYERCD